MVDFSVLMAGISGGSFGFLFGTITEYVLARRKGKEERHYAAKMLQIEIQRILDVTTSKDFERNQTVPEMEIYHAMLNSGSFRYLDEPIRDDLNRLYLEFKRGECKPDNERYLQIMKKLAKADAGK